MAGVLALWRHQVRHRWRAFRARGIAAINSGLSASVLFGLALASYIQELRTIQVRPDAGDRATGIITFLICAWALSSYFGAATCFNVRLLTHYPLARWRLYLARVILTAITPAGLMTAVLSILALAYVEDLSFRLSVIASGLAGCAAGGLAYDVASTRRSRLLGAFGVGLLTVFVSGTVALGVPAQMATAWRSFASDHWVLWLATPVAVAACKQVFSWSLTQPSHEGRALVPARAVILPTRLGGLVQQELYNTATLLDFYVGLLISLGLSLYVVNVPAPETAPLLMAPVLLVIVNPSVPLNLFGFDTQGSLDRYAIFPLTSRDIVICKVASACLLLALQVLPLAVVVAWRCGIPVTLVLLEVSGAVFFLLLGWGLHTSVKLPFRLRRHTFSAGGSLIYMLLALTVSLIPFTLVLPFVRTERGVIAGAGVLCVATFVLAWSIRTAAGRLPGNREYLRSSLRA